MEGGVCLQERNGSNAKWRQISWKAEGNRHFVSCVWSVPLYMTKMHHGSLSVAARMQFSASPHVELSISLFRALQPQKRASFYSTSLFQDGEHLWFHLLKTILTILLDRWALATEKKKKRERVVSYLQFWQSLRELLEEQRRRTRTTQQGSARISGSQPSELLRLLRLLHGGGVSR